MNGRPYRIVEKPDAVADYIAIARHVEAWTQDRALADRTLDRIRAAVRDLAGMPYRGVPRDDLRAGVRLLFPGRKTAIAYEIDEPAREVRVLRIFYGGQDYEAVLGGPDA